MIWKWQRNWWITCLAMSVLPVFLTRIWYVSIEPFKINTIPERPGQNTAFSSYQKHASKKQSQNSFPESTSKAGFWYLWAPYLTKARKSDGIFNTRSCWFSCHLARFQGSTSDTYEEFKRALNEDNTIKEISRPRGMERARMNRFRD